MLPELPTFATTNNILSECLSLEAKCVTTFSAMRKASWSLFSYSILFILFWLVYLLFSFFSPFLMVCSDSVSLVCRLGWSTPSPSLLSCRPLFALRSTCALSGPRSGYGRFGIAFRSIFGCWSRLSNVLVDLPVNIPLNEPPVWVLPLVPGVSRAASAPASTRGKCPKLSLLFS